MMELHFAKYHGTGNDFLLIDNREKNIVLQETEVARLCHRRFGVGGDGLMLLEEAEGADFRMVYYNSDGRPSTMCGNGGRCIVAFAARLGLIADKAKFLAVDGLHTANRRADGIVELHMNDVTSVQRPGQGIFILDTGSPHFVKAVSGVSQLDVPAEGRSVRYSPPFRNEGINVNFMEATPGGIFVRTYERGVEDETLSCGTGVTAAAIASTADRGPGSFHVQVGTPGGELQVRFDRMQDGRVSDVVLSGPAVHVFDGVTWL